MQIRVMYVVDHLQIGGTQSHLLQLVSRLDRQCVVPMVCALRARGEVVGMLEGLDVPIFDGGLGRSLKGWGGVRVLWRLTRLLRRERVHVVHSYLFHPNVLAPIAGRLAGVPAVVVSKRSLDRYPDAVRRHACKLGNALADRITVNAEAVGRFVRAEEGCRPEKMVLIPNGVNGGAPRSGVDGRRMREELNWPDGPTVGTVSRLAWKKGLEHLLEAVPCVLESVPEARFVIVGDGPLRAELEARARALQIGDRVAFLGSRRDAPALLSAFDVFVLPSVIEGMSNALLEAMGAAVPVVATDVGGNSELVADGRTGFLVPLRDPHQLAAAIVKLLQAPELAREMGAAGRRLVAEQYPMDVMVRRLQDLYETLLARGASRP